MTDFTDIDKRLTTHEAVCAERYGQLLTRMSRVEVIMLSTAGTLLIGMGTLMMKLVFGSTS